jgi:hypothetical protein
LTSVLTNRSQSDVVFDQVRVFPPLRPESGHLLHLDALRLIASAGIVVLHSAPFLDAGLMNDRIVNSARSLGVFVDMFFAVSGFVIAFVYFAKIMDVRSYRLFSTEATRKTGATALVDPRNFCGDRPYGPFSSRAHESCGVV